jgi:putative transposase
MAPSFGARHGVRMSPRPHRVQAAGATYHVFAHATGEEMLHRDGPDRDRLLSVVEQTVEKFDLEVHFYVVLSTHHHLLVTTRQPNLASAMQYLQGVYCQTYNRRHGRKGHLVAGRYGANLVESESYAAWLIPYLALNPVRAGLVDRPEDWPWSSYASLIGLAPGPSFVRSSSILEQFHPDPLRARELLREYVELVLAQDSVAA